MMVSAEETGCTQRQPELLYSSSLRHQGHFSVRFKAEIMLNVPDVHTSALSFSVKIAYSAELVSVLNIISLAYYHV